MEENKQLSNEEINKNIQEFIKDKFREEITIEE